MSVTDKELDELEKQIEAKAEEAPKAPEPVAETPPEPTPEPPPAAAASEPPGSDPAQVDLAEWVKKKGFKSQDDVARSLRELEQAYHRKNNEELARPKEQQPPFQPGWPTPPAAYQPPQGYYAPPQPQYAPPQNPYAPPVNPYAPQPRITKAQVAASYNMTEEDFDRVMAVARDIASVQTQQVQADMQAWRAKTERDSEKANDLQNVMTDPAFHNPDVQFEMHDILEKNKDMWTDRRPYTSALNQALTNIARKTLGGGTRPSGSTLPTEPPKSGGHAGGGLPGKRGLGGLPSLEEQQRMKPEELEKLLRSMNAVKNYGDY
jgi:hypothetical protein